MTRYDFHTHSIFSDGELVPSEMARRLELLEHRAFAITDHADNSNLEFILRKLVPACEELSKHFEIEIIPGIELTHLPLDMFEPLAKKARKLGAKIVVAHGETPAEPVIPGTNKTISTIPEIDIIAHPGLISYKEAENARENGIYLELTSRRGHCLANGHIVKVAKETKAEMLLNTDGHIPEDFISQNEALKVAMGAGLSKKDSEIVTTVNYEKILRNL